MTAPDRIYINKVHGQHPEDWDFTDGKYLTKKQLAAKVEYIRADLPARGVGVPADVRDYAIDVSEAFDTMMEVERNPAGAWQVIQALAGHIIGEDRT